MKQEKEKAVSNTKIAIVFFVFLIFVVVLSLTFKIIGIISRGQFDSEKRFNLAITNSRNTEIMSFSGSRNIAVFKFDGNIHPLEAGRFLEVPVDGIIALTSLNLNQKVNSLFINTIFNYNRLKTNLTIIDLLKIAMLARTIPENAINIRTVGNRGDLQLDKIVGRLVVDDLIEKDNQTIQIINGTDIGGLGNRLARLITNMGGDVIIVASSDSPKKKSSISYIDKKTYTVEKLQKMLAYEVVKEVNAISDITITIGEDKVNNLSF